MEIATTTQQTDLFGQPAKDYRDERMNEARGDFSQKTEIFTPGQLFMPFGFFHLKRTFSALFIDNVPVTIFELYFMGTYCQNVLLVENDETRKIKVTEAMQFDSSFVIKKTKSRPGEETFEIVKIIEGQ